MSNQIPTKHIVFIVTECTLITHQSSHTSISPKQFRLFTVRTNLAQPLDCTQRLIHIKHSTALHRQVTI